MEEIFKKYSDSVIKNIDKDNILKIVGFLKQENCEFIEELVEDYLDLFTIDFVEFATKYEQLNKKYNYNFLEKVSNDMNLLEEFFII